MMMILKPLSKLVLTLPFLSLESNPCTRSYSTNLFKIPMRSSMSDFNDIQEVVSRERCNSLDTSGSDDSAKRVHLPILKYGYRTEPMSWDEMIDAVTVQNDLAKLSRSIEQQKEYEIYKRDLLVEWRSVTDKVLCSKFGNFFEKCIDSETGLAFAFPPLENLTGISAKVLLQNDFPYYMQNGIEHWILWKIGMEPCTNEDIAEAKNELAKKQKLNQFIHWVNPPHLMSLPDIHHVHILGRENT